MRQSLRSLPLPLLKSNQENCNGRIEQYASQSTDVESKEPEMILIKRNESDEYEVPMGLNKWKGVEVYYTDDIDDACDTARSKYGADCVIRIEEGSYGE